MSDWHTQELVVRRLMDSLESSYKSGAITTSQYESSRDHLAARLHDLLRAQRHDQARQNYLGAQQMMQATMHAAQYGLLNQAPAVFQQAPPPPNETVRIIPCEDAFGELIAWRCWKTPKLPVLTSTYRVDYIWMPQQIEEAKDVQDRNGLGFHAWQDERQATGYGLSLGETIVVGRVKLWGDVIHHEKGYRAQFAKILSLDTFLTAYTRVEDTLRALTLLRRHYRVEPKKGE